MNKELNVNVTDVKQKFGDRFRVNVGGGTMLVITVILLGVLTYTASISNELSRSNELRRQQLEVSKRQYMLDSLRFEYLKNMEK